MKSIHLKEVQQDKDSNQWLYEEDSGITHIQKHKQWN